jgi:ATP-dependent DNA helicase RecQ
VIEKSEQTAEAHGEPLPSVQPGAFVIPDGADVDGPVLLVDDVVDSAWTLTLAAALLKQAGAGAVFPFALATTAAK